MVEVFKTNVKQKKYARELVVKIQLHFPELLVNFDLNDCDNILRIEGENVTENEIKKIVLPEGYFCEVLV
jgi:hypothetical protein